MAASWPLGKSQWDARDDAQGKNPRARAGMVGGALLLAPGTRNAMGVQGPGPYFSGVFGRAGRGTLLASGSSLYADTDRGLSDLCGEPCYSARPGEAGASAKR